MNSRTSMLRTMLIAFGIALAGVNFPVFAGQGVSERPASGSAWKFRVYLDEKEIGYHHFYLAETGDIRQLRSVASFEYRLMFIPMFNYEHENSEIWNGDCLQSINSSTDSNGEPFRVNGKRGDGEFRVSSNGGEESLPECVMSFAYWNPSFLEQPTLLNTQDGTFLPVSVSEPVPEELEINGEQVSAYRYNLEAGELSLDVWYSEAREWLALESEVRGGRKLRYVLGEGTVLNASAGPEGSSATQPGRGKGMAGLGN